MNRVRLFLDLSEARKDEDGEDDGQHQDDDVQVEGLALFTNLTKTREHIVRRGVHAATSPGSRAGGEGRRESLA